MKKRNTTLFLILAVLVIGAIVFFVLRPSSNKNDVRQDIRDSAANIVELINSDAIADSIASQKYDLNVEDESSVLLDLEEQLYVIEPNTPSEEALLACVSYALYARYYESMLNVLSTGDELELYGYVTNSEASEVANTLNSLCQGALEAYNTNDISQMRSFVEANDINALSLIYHEFYDKAVGASEQTDQPEDSIVPDEDNTLAPSDDSDSSDSSGGISLDINGGLSGSGSSSGSSGLSGGLDLSF